MTLRHYTWQILEGQRKDPLGLAVHTTILVLILLNVAALIVETVPGIQPRLGNVLEYFYTVSMIIFSVEYGLRLWACTSDPRFRRPLLGRWKFALSPMGLMDALAILPFYVPQCGVDLRCMRAFRLLRLFRLVRVTRKDSPLDLMRDVFHEQKEELMITSAAMLIVLVVSSSLIFYVENPVQPDAFSSIPASMWWAVATLTTVGYGDVYPVSSLGRLLGSIIAMVGIGMFALPAGILGSGFVEQIQRRRRRQEPCPHCGKSLETPRHGSSDL